MFGRKKKGVPIGCSELHELYFKKHPEVRGILLMEGAEIYIRSQSSAEIALAALKDMERDIHKEALVRAAGVNDSLNEKVNDSKEAHE